MRVDPPTGDKKIDPPSINEINPPWIEDLVDPPIM